MNAFDFSLIDRLPSYPAGAGRLLLSAPPAHGQPLLLFVHGAYHGAWCYANYLAYFTGQDVACAALDLPGHGGLPQDASFLHAGIRDLAVSVQRAAERLEGPVVLVGHSMGALPVLVAAAEMARAPAGVVLLAPSPPANLPGAAALPPVPEDVLRAPPGDKEIRERFAGCAADVDVSAIRLRLCAESPQVLNDRYALRVAVNPFAMRSPGLCVEAGLDDPARHPAGQDRAIADFFGFEHRLLADQPHAMMYGERWESSAEVLLDWYRRTYDRRRGNPR
ncbi:alpha/beta hydrolase [Bordetella genomosp. 10]|uniref:Alpha/beta hydrolase n=1 Tax=Bordetella genomosp. 10 TaxID=1416804 RepID=A0A261S9C5_9BORD|nr:alpha/beta fold hydrolase [Bordetella genomosp. 10]OZI33989.1 alpha/beta hydrolase [Bordetella genomosp. 10]